ncbi:hypothetical protein ACFQAT_23055 [Undibacterium arcticum]|uniref:hypothetical protein n=1 Tax=Undibacterium arcticum TaxID=1762892 RepID=UPI00362222C8
MAISFFNNLEEVKDLSNQAAAAMSATGLMGCDCIKSTNITSSLNCAGWQYKVGAIRQALKKYSTKNYDRFLFRVGSSTE